METRTVNRLVRDVLEALKAVIVTRDELLEKVVASVLAGGHILFEDFPGLGKTLLCTSLAQALGLRFQRIQFTPDLLPGDITGGYLYNRTMGTFEFRPGPVFANLVLADEINRASPKTQSALLEVMQERQVTVEGERFAVEQPFMVVATQNAIEFEGTYPLPEAQLDRFMMRVSLGYPDPEEEQVILRRRLERARDAVVVPQVTTKAEVGEMQRFVEGVHVSAPVQQYIVALVRATRGHPSVEVGASPRAGLALMQLSRALAAVRGRAFVIPDDVKAVAVDVLAHRLVLKAELWAARTRPEQIVRDILSAVPVPVPGSLDGIAGGQVKAAG
ncbi:MAG: MoxR family ATPase [Bacillota bacterium]